MRTILLFALISCGQLISAQDSIFNGGCNAYFRYEVNNQLMFPYAATAINFYDLSEGKINEWYWDFGNGNTSSEQNPLFIFVHPSSTTDIDPYRTVSLTILADSCKSVYSEIINIMDSTRYLEPVCKAGFTYYLISFDSISATSTVQFTNLSEGDSLIYFWNFNDGRTSTEYEPTVTFNPESAVQMVCLTIYTADSCVNTWCETITISDSTPDTVNINNSECNYTMRLTSGFPYQASSCAGYAHAQVYLGDSLVEAYDYTWSDGTPGQDVKYLCPTKTYTVKAKTLDGCVVSNTFIFNSDGTISEIPVNWRITGSRDNPIIQYDLNDTGFTGEWRLCDGTIVKSDTIPLSSINCGTEEPNLIIRDSAGNVVYSETISLKSIFTGTHFSQVEPKIKLYPNPVNETLHILFSGDHLNKLQVEIFDISGRRISLHELRNIESGQLIHIDMRSQRKGIYLCKLILDKKGTFISKFSKF